MKNYKNLNEVLARNAQELGDKVAFRFQSDYGDKDDLITYKQLYQRVKILSAKLREMANIGDRVLLLYPPGIEFIISFFGCLDAGVIAVPSYTPNKRNVSKLEGIIENANIKLGLCNKETYQLVNAFKFKQDQVSNLLSVKFVQVEMKEVLSDSIDYTPTVDVEPDNIAFLQYTSGSTSQPKGVMVTHKNLLANSECIKSTVHMAESNHMVSWLPPFHDMGLIGKIIQPIYSGASATLMSPISFIKNPSKWLIAISDGSKYGSVVSGAPNFAFDLCVDKITDEQLPKGFSLENWKVAFSGAEPVREKTLKRFYKRFAEYGFTYDKFFPVYGLAEGTLMTTSGDIQKDPIINNYDLKHIEEDEIAIEVDKSDTRSKSYVACGRAVPNHIVKIVNPESFRVCLENEIGEIWVKGDSVAKGYWSNQEKTNEIFNAYTANEEGPFMRTGDKGFFEGDEIFIAGRIKDMIIINGKNYYPEDIEVSVINAHSSLKKGGTAVIAAEIKDNEKLVVVQEITKKDIHTFNEKEIFSAIKYEVMKNHELLVDEIVLISTSSIPKTTSGKVQRYRVRQYYLNNKLKRVKGKQFSEMK